MRVFCHEISPGIYLPATEDAVALELIDEVIPIDGNHALEMARQLALKEGIFCGTSAGATFSGAMEVAETAPPNTTIPAPSIIQIKGWLYHTSEFIRDP